MSKDIFYFAKKIWFCWNH